MDARGGSRAFFSSPEAVRRGAGAGLISSRIRWRASLVTASRGRPAAPGPGRDKMPLLRSARWRLAWFLLIVAGLLEVGWAIGLKYTEGFTRLWPSVLTGAAIVASMGLLGVAARAIPIGTAYAVWVGIGAAGASVLGIVLFGEPASPMRLVFLALLVISVAGLKVTAGS